VRYARLISIDILRALGVLALIFLSFVHAPVPGFAGDQDVLTAAVDFSYCGDDPVGTDRAHAPCHACRVLGTALPPPPCAAIAAPVASTPAPWFGAVVSTADRLAQLAARPRAPPALV